VREPSKSEVRFVEMLVDALVDESPNVRAAAEEAVRTLGGAAVRVILRDLQKYDTNTRGAALRVLEGMGTVALAEIQGLAARPRGVAGKELAAVEESLAKTASPTALEGDPKVHAAVERIVRTLPRNTWSSNSPLTDQLVALGRPAVPALLVHLDPAAEERLEMARQYVVDALRRLATRDDLHTLGRLLDDGWEAAAAVLQGLDDSRAVPYLGSALTRGQMSQAIGEALLHYRDPRTVEPALTFLEGAGGSLEQGIDKVLEMLVALQATEALPVIRRNAQAPAPIEAGLSPGPGFEFPGEKTRREVVFGKAIAGLGDREGLPLLIGALDARGMDEWLAREAGEALNRLTGQYHWRGAGSGAAAKASYTRWWEANRARLEWNAKRQRYVVPD
jgi:HEAT repeat protein